MAQAELYYQSEDQKYALYWYGGLGSDKWTTMVLTTPPEEGKANSDYLRSLGARYNSKLGAGIGPGWLFFLYDRKGGYLGPDLAVSALKQIQSRGEGGVPPASPPPIPVQAEVKSQLDTVKAFSSFLAGIKEPTGRIHEKQKRGHKEYEFFWGSPEQVEAYEASLFQFYSQTAHVQFKVSFGNKAGMYSTYSSYTGT